MAKILYVEDNEDNVYMLKRRLERDNRRVLAAIDAMRRLAGARADLGMAPVTVAELQALPLLAELEARHPGTLPLVLAAAVGDAAAERRLRRMLSATSVVVPIVSQE
jgi:CheY-like chemotaxis protein